MSKYLNEKPDLVRRQGSYHVEAVHRIKTDRVLTLKVVTKYMRVTDREAMEKSYEDIVDDQFVRQLDQNGVIDGLYKH